MTNTLLQKYFNYRSFYRLQAEGTIDNPDQRLNDDVAQFCSTSISLAQSLLTSVFDLVSFSGILLSIYPPLFGLLFLYAAGGTVATFRIGNPLARLNFQQERSEADFRYSLVRVRENAESVAFYGGEGRERSIAMQRLKKAVDTIMDQILVSRNLVAFQVCFMLSLRLLWYTNHSSCYILMQTCCACHCATVILQAICSICTSSSGGATVLQWAH